MAKFFLCYNSAHLRFALRFRDFMESLQLGEVFMFDGGARRPVWKEIEHRMAATDAVVVLYGPGRKGVSHIPEFPATELILARCMKKPTCIFYHAGMELLEVIRSSQTAQRLGSFSKDDLTKNLRKVERRLRELAQDVRGSSKARRPVPPVVRELTEGALHLKSIHFYKIAEKVRELMARNDIIDTKYLFASTRSCGLYRKLVEDPDYSRPLSTGGLFSANAQDIASRLQKEVGSARSLGVVSLGLGTGEHEATLLKELVKRKITVSFLGIDINPAFIQAGMHNVQKATEDSSVEHRFLFGDFDELLDLSRTAAVLPKDRPLLFLVTGGLLGNQNEQELLRKLKSVPGKDRFLLIDFLGLDSRGRDLAAYNCEANKNFIRNVVQIFCDEHVEPGDIHARWFNEIEDLNFRGPPSAVAGARTIVMEARTSGRQKPGPPRVMRYVGYSTRYNATALRRFLEGHGFHLLGEQYKQGHTFLQLLRF